MKKHLLLALISGFVLAGFASIYFVASSNFFDMKPPREMLDLRPGNDYADDWRRVDSLQQKGLTQSALELVNGIYDKAKREDNSPQVVKAVIHIMKFTQNVEEESLVKNILRLRKEIEGAKYPLEPMLHSLLAEHYFRYYNENYWRFSQRTETVQVNEEDPRTWDPRKIVRAALDHYLLSLENRDSLQRTRIDYYDVVLVKEHKSRLFRPTLYDLLAHRALDMLNDETASLTQPAYVFRLEGTEAFGGDEEFLRARYESQDTFSFQRQALLILQELTRFHAADTSPEARIFVTLERLNYARRVSIHSEKDSLYEAGLRNLLARSQSHEVGTWISYHLANFHEGKAGEYNPTAGDAHKWENKTALEICNAAIARFPLADGAVACQATRTRILNKELTLTTEQINLPNQPFRTLVRYRNVEKLWFRVVPISESERRDLEDMNSDDMARKLSGMKSVNSWTVTLPADPDYNAHRVELAIPALPAGYYAVLAGTSESMAVDKQAVAYSFVWASHMAYAQRSDRKYAHQFFVFDRATGAPLTGVAGQMWLREYDYDKRKYIYRKGGTYTTNKEGYFDVSPPSSDSRSYYMEFTHQGQSLRTNDNWYQYRTWDGAEHSYQTVFFTDRGIYRPGQTIYFKGILLEKTGDRTRIRPNTSTTVTFYDVNYQRVADLNLRSNEFGSVSGTFTAPQGLLNGQMHIEDGNGSAYFSVEDYKRPKFEVVMDPVKGSFRLNEKVKVSGKAMAYAGSNIDGADVTYRVVRTATFPYCYWPWWRPRPVSPAMEIINGKVTTDELGAFSIEFEAIPDKSISPETKPEFQYQVMVDVTDITGETHSTTAWVRVGTVALSADMNLNGYLEAGKKHNAALSTRNLNGEFEAAKGSLNIHRLKMPDRVFRSRLWDMPDKFLMSKEEYYRNFPQDLYQAENSMETWPKEQEVYAASFDTEKEDSLLLGELKNWQAGAYVAEMKTQDRFGTPVTVIKYFHVYNLEGGKPPVSTAAAYIPRDMEGEPGEVATFVYATAEDSIWTLYEIEHKGTIVKREWRRISRGATGFAMPITEDHRGNFTVYLTTVRHGRFYSEAPTVYVPWTNKTLKLEFATFRDKLLPGSKEEWTMKVSGKNGEKVAAEMVAGMYDASLDAFRSISWGLNVNPIYYGERYWQQNSAFSTVGSNLFAPDWNPYLYAREQGFDYLNWFGYSFSDYAFGRYYRSGYADGDDFGGDEVMMDAEMEEAPVEASKSAPPSPKAEGGKDLKNAAGQTVTETASTGMLNQQKRTETRAGDGQEGPGEVQVRTNLNETAFFFPHLRTNEKGEVIVSFTIPEALTRWRMMAFAHTTDLMTGYAEKSVVTQKELMVMPNPPRFFRESDRIAFSSKISNLADKDLSGSASLELFDAMTMQPIDAKLGNGQPNQAFAAKKGQSTVLFWELKIPSGIQAVTYRVKARAGNFSDGEEAALPVLSNTMLVTETMPLPVRPKQTRTFTFDKLQNNKSTTLRHHKLTLEFTSNPAWYAVQALPYLMEYPYECTEQTFSRFYANSLASHVANSSPRIKQVFDTWASRDKEALLSNLEKNQELKALLLEETPWVLQAQDESERKRRVGLLFDLNRMGNELSQALRKLQKAQVSNGGWPWFPGMPESRYITQHIACGMGHLDHLGVRAIREDNDTWNMCVRAVKYLDERIREDYEYLIRYKADLTKNNLGYDHVHYLYMRSYFKDVPVEKRNQEAVAYYFGQGKKYWVDFGRYLQGMIALYLHRGGETTVAKDVIKSLKENAIYNDEMGMYWKDNAVWGIFWYQAPIETQALLIEAFDEVANDTKSVEEMKIWLLKQKQTQDWKTTKATTEAVYALLLRGTDLLAESQLAEITIGGQKIDPLNLPDTRVEAGTGYFKTSWMGSDVKPEMGKVEVKNPNNVVAWGAVYWQYFEQLDKITFAETNLKLKKELFLQENSPTGPKISPVKPGQVLKPGDLVKVRIVLVSDRDMEYVHMKDMRAAGFEPVNVISRYKWQDGLGYYESTRDAATNFFIDYLRKGTYVFEYPLRVTHQGDFSNGITTIQCMYAPEFTAHSEGVRVLVKK